jgi:S1-C subfamily serine protease
MKEQDVRLGPREQQVVELLLEGCDNAEIASQFTMAQRTIKALYRLFLRLGLAGGIKRVKFATPPTSLSDSSAPPLMQGTQQSTTDSDSPRRMMEVALTILLLLGALAMAHHYYAPVGAQGALPTDLQKQVHELMAQVEQLQQEQGMPATVLNRYRNSIGYIHAVYQLGFANQRPTVRAHISGTGFIIGDGLVATNRHLAEPWYGDSEAEALIHHGACARLESLVVFFPGSPKPVNLSHALVSTTSDLAVLRAEKSNMVPSPLVLPLASVVGSPGQLVTVIGYPMGVAGMVAKSPSRVHQRFSYRHKDINAVSELAALSLIRPSVTYGHLGDVIGDKLIYDAPTAHGGSGGPVFNAKGEVIGVNFAYMEGFSGSTLGISVESLRPLLEEAQK